MTSLSWSWLSKFVLSTSVLFFAAAILLDSSPVNGAVSEAEAALVFGGCSGIKEDDNANCPGCSQSQGYKTDGNGDNSLKTVSCGSGCGTRTVEQAGCGG